MWICHVSLQCMGKKTGFRHAFRPQVAAALKTSAFRRLDQ